MSQTEEEVDCDKILHQWQRDQSEQQRPSRKSQRSDDVVEVVYVPGVDMCVLEGQLSCVPTCKIFYVTQCTTGSSQRSISAMTGCHWRSEDDVAERVESHDDVT